MLRLSQNALQYALLFLCVVALLMSGCSNEVDGQRPPPLVLPSQSPSQATQAILQPVPGLLAPIPADCQPTLPPGSISYQSFPGFIGNVTLLGDGHAWIRDDIRVLHLNADGAHPFPSRQVFWIVGPDPTQKVTVQGHDQQTGTPIWFQIDQSTPATSMELIPGESEDGGKTADGRSWDTWLTMMIIVKAGCYDLEASWPTGHWAMTIAAGR